MGFLDTLLGKDASAAANSAAFDTYQKQSAASEAQRKAGNQFQGDVTGYAQAYSPYVEGGGRAQDQVYSLLGLNGGGAQSGAYDQFRSDPGYQFQQQQGVNAIDRSAASRGMLNSGAQLKALDRYGQGVADQSYGNYLQRLMTLGGQGLGATGQQANLLTQGSQGNLNAQLNAGQQQFNSAGTIGQGQVAGANAEAGALGNILGAASYLGGAALGGGASSFGGKNINPFGGNPYSLNYGSNPFTPSGGRNPAYG